MELETNSKIFPRLKNDHQQSINNSDEKRKRDQKQAEKEAERKEALYYSFRQMVRTRQF